MGNTVLGTTISVIKKSVKQFPWTKPLTGHKFWGEAHPKSARPSECRGRGGRWMPAIFWNEKQQQRYGSIKNNRLDLHRWGVGIPFYFDSRELCLGMQLSLKPEPKKKYALQWHDQQTSENHTKGENGNGYKSCTGKKFLDGRSVWWYKNNTGHWKKPWHVRSLFLGLDMGWGVGPRVGWEGAGGQSTPPPPPATEGVRGGPPPSICVRSKPERNKLYFGGFWKRKTSKSLSKHWKEFKP